MRGPILCSVVTNLRLSLSSQWEGRYELGTWQELKRRSPLAGPGEQRQGDDHRLVRIMGSTAQQ